MALEFAALQAHATNEHYLLPVLAAEDGGDHLILDWATMIDQILADVRRGNSTGRIALKFHNALVEAAVETVRRLDDRLGIEEIVLSGGCFQNKLLTESLILRLRQSGHRVHWHKRIPPNDGGVAVGQVIGD